MYEQYSGRDNYIYIYNGVVVLVCLMFATTY